MDLFVLLKLYSKNTKNTQRFIFQRIFLFLLFHGGFQIITAVSVNTITIIVDIQAFSWSQIKCILCHSCLELQGFNQLLISWVTIVITSHPDLKMYSLHLISWQIRRSYEHTRNTYTRTSLFFQGINRGHPQHNLKQSKI